MTVFEVREVLEATGAELVRGAATGNVKGVSTDTRTLTRCALFLALEGEHFDGNRFAAEALEKGAGMLILRGKRGDPLPDLPGDAPIAMHERPRRALGLLAAAHRARLGGRVVGVTGSCGKTTTKNILSELLGSRCKVVVSPSSFNNDVGVPHTLLLADETTDTVVVEMGTNGPGEIGALARIARPCGGIVTNVGPAHLEGLGSIEGVAREKSELFAALPADGFAVLNLDSRCHPILRQAIRARTLTISVEGDGEFNATDPHFESGYTIFKLAGREVASPLLGVHNISNLLTALAACVGLGFDLDDVLPAVERLKGGRQRMERHEIGDLVVLDDSYNANPDSALAALRVLCGLHGYGRRVFVLGDMLELGPSAPELHHELGERVANSCVDLFVVVGELARAAASGALVAGMARSQVVHFETTMEAELELPELLEPLDVVLIKGSRRMGLERLVARLKTAEALRLA